MKIFIIGSGGREHSLSCGIINSESFKKNNSELFYTGTSAGLDKFAKNAGTVSSNVNELADFAPELDWETLRTDMKQYGVRNATLMAVAPVESSSVVINSTNGIEMPMSLISVKESKAGSFIQVVPEYHKLKNKYQMMWEQIDCAGYLKTAAVLAVYVDQSISTNTFYNPAHFPGRKVPTTLIAKNLMQAHLWGIKTFYYSLINKQGSKEEEEAPLEIIDFDDEDESCESCKL